MARATRNSAQTIRELLEAAKAVVCESGAARLTLDAVVKRAGLSKGAILHHFKTKADLVHRLMQDAIDEFNQQVAAERGDDHSPGSYTRAYVNVTERISAEAARSHYLSLMTELVRDSESREIFADAAMEWSQAIENDGFKPYYAQLIRMAADGLLLYESSGFPLDSKVREELVTHLRQMTAAA